MQTTIKNKQSSLNQMFKEGIGVEQKGQNGVSYCNLPEDFNFRKFAAAKAALTKKTNLINHSVKCYNRKVAALKAVETRTKNKKLKLNSALDMQIVETAKAVKQLTAGQKAACTRKRRLAAKKAVLTRKANQKALLT